MRFSFVIINFRTPDLTCQCLDSIFKYCHGDFEVILIDNASGDDSLTLLKSAISDSVKLIENSANLGFARANNQGAALASGELLFFLNSDTVIEDDILLPLGRFFNENREVAVSSPRLFVDGATPQLKAYGRFPKLLNLVFKNFRLKAAQESDLNIDWVSGAALIIRRDVFKQAGGWDEKFFMYMEDTDLCWRVKEMGHKVSLCSQARIIHLGGKSIDQDRQRRKYYFKSQNYFFYKHYGLLVLVVLIVIRWPYKIIKYFQDSPKINGK
ncbi:MAG: glycosyltransferase family 2 protein [Patescibacteria group bacterium]